MQILLVTNESLIIHLPVEFTKIGKKGSLVAQVELQKYHQTLISEMQKRVKQEIDAERDRQVGRSLLQCRLTSPDKFVLQSLFLTYSGEPASSTRDRFKSTCRILTKDTSE